LIFRLSKQKWNDVERMKKAVPFFDNIQKLFLNKSRKKEEYVE